MSATFNPAMSTDEICVGTNSTLCLTDYLDDLETEVGNKAAATHSHTDLESAIEGLEDGKAEAVHTHEMSAVTGLIDKLSEIDSAIAALQNGGGSTVAPMLVASMHLGKLDNNSGAENSSSTRICSDPFAVEPGTTYYQVNDKGVNMYVLLYDADELFLEYMGSFASGAAIPVNNANAAYMRLGSLLGEYDLTNEFRIYDVDPESGSTAADGFTQEDADILYAPIEHTHTDLHSHSNKAVLDSITAEKVAAWDAGTGSGSGYVHPDTHPATMIEGLSAVATSGDYNDLANKPASLPANGGNADTVGGVYPSAFASSGHTHTAADVGAAASNHSHDPMAIGAAPYSHEHNYASTGHSHTPSEVGAVPATGGEFTGEVTIPYGLGTGSVYPFDSGSYAIGSSDNRYYSVYLRVNPNVSSDSRCKRDISALDVSALAEFVDKLSVVSYNYNDDSADEGERIGLVAQDVLAANPKIARFFVEQDSNGFYSLRPADFVFPLIAAVQELSRKVAELEANR